jgi:AraC-like DNA-binding protein
VKKFFRAFFSKSSKISNLFLEKIKKMYTYREYNPDPRLSSWVKDYWSASDFVYSKVGAKVFPDGGTDIIFEFDQTKGTAHAELFGTSTTFIEVNYPEFIESGQMFGIRFKPAAIAAFTRVPLNEITNKTVELPLLESLFDRSFYEELPTLKSPQEMIAHTNRYLLKQLPRLYSPSKRIIYATELIHSVKGKLNMTDLAAAVCLGQRHFEREFKSAIGVSPKMFAKVARFNHAMSHLADFRHKTLLTIAEECGYYDHTHLILDFKAFSGDTPTEFREKLGFYFFGEGAWY